MTRNFTVELKLIVQRKRQTVAVQYNMHSAAIQDAEPEEGEGMKTILQNAVWVLLLRKEEPKTKPYLKPER
eukprot:1806874-Amphidinium_carterae.2